jgi:pimeloyl-ACP methyl ester carboxylesterase
MVLRNPLRARMLSTTPLRERRLALNGLSTAILEGGQGSPIILLHGAGGFAAAWLRVVPDLLRSHRVIAPDLPGHGETSFWPEPPDAERLVGWLDDLLDCSCEAAPTLVGQTLGGAIAAAYAAARGERLAALVLVDALGLADFEPDPAFGSALGAYLAGPSEETHDALMHQCLFDYPRVQRDLGPAWPAFSAYLADRALAPGHIAALGALMQQAGVPAMPAGHLASIGVPTTLIWGRRDRATPLAVAERASERFGWPLHVIEDSGDEPPLEQPAAFMAALRAAIVPAPAQRLAR